MGTKNAETPERDSPQKFLTQQNVCGREAVTFLPYANNAALAVTKKLSDGNLTSGTSAHLQMSGKHERNLFSFVDAQRPQNGLMQTLDC